MSIVMRVKRALFSEQVALTEKQNRILNIVFFTTLIGTFVSMLGIILYYVYAFASLSNGSDAFDWLLGIFSDFVYITEVSLIDSPYLSLIDDGSSYPPLAIAVLFPFALICKGVYGQYINTDGITIDEFTSKVVQHPEFWISFVLFFTLCSLAVIITVIKVYKLPPMPSLKVSIIILLCAPFVYAIMRGNTIYFAMIFLLLFLLLYEHKNAFWREVGYLCLVLAGLIKIYPLFFGVYLLHKKKIWASVRIAIYTVVLFFLSFFLYEGLEELPRFINNLGGFMSTEHRLLEGNNLSISAFIYKIFSLFVNITPDFPAFNIVNICVLSVVFLCSTVAAVYTRNSFSRAAIASAIVILVPSISYFYILIFALLPFMEFLRGYEDMDKRRRILYTVTFLFLFLTPTILAKNFIVHSLLIIIMLGVECARVFKCEMLPNIRKKALVKNN
ncbi:MAG: DUF2029 domain-containing protein [Ruminococcaceae bacterium]|nr:DUF2029 domain-containing protein [Oscillospiraceae bacterium]